MEDQILIVDKPLGVTSFDVIRDLKKKYSGQKIGHAGTLDPLASGVLICLIGKESNKRQDEFMNVEKEYEFEVLFGFKTDTYDILGKTLDSKNYDIGEKLKELRSLLRNYTGAKKQRVPPFSAVKVKGKPLYRWFLEGKIDQVEIPIKEIEIKSLEILEIKILSMAELYNQIVDVLNLVKSGFRNHEVRNGWDQVLNYGNEIEGDDDVEEGQNSRQKEFLIVRFKSTVSKGTYVRAIANDLGEKLGIGACTITIRRTRVGEFKSE